MIERPLRDLTEPHRFVRLPIPGCDQINLLNARYADFEKQGGQMLRVPFFVRGHEAEEADADAAICCSTLAPQRLGVRARLGTVFFNFFLAGDVLSLAGAV